MREPAYLSLWLYHPIFTSRVYDLLFNSLMLLFLPIYSILASPICLTKLVLWSPTSLACSFLIHSQPLTLSPWPRVLAESEKKTKRHAHEDKNAATVTWLQDISNGFKKKVAAFSPTLLIRVSSFYLSIYLFFPLKP